MSGFIAIVQDNNHSVNTQQLKQLTSLMANQGPDAQKIWSLDHVGFGHALLKTTHESRLEQQPLTIDQRVWITGDIRLDRRNELIEQLSCKGQHAEQSLPDVNLVLMAYLAWGDQCLQKISGDFAFAIWDSRQQRLFCARDQFGVVPFYYASVNGQLICSNHLLALSQYPDISTRLNNQAIGDFLLFGMNLDLNTTTFKDIQKLAPAHQLVLTANTLEISTYWQLPESGHFIRYPRSNDYIEHFLELFEQSIADRLRTDRAASHLSGGMDSTSIAATIHHLMQQSGNTFDFRAYAIVYQHLLKEEEGKYAAQVAQRAGFQLETLNAEDFITQAPLPNPDFMTPEPLMFANQVAEHDITRRVSSFSRVLFAGFGGDPAFFPVSSYWLELLQKGQFGRLIRDFVTFIHQKHRLPPLGLYTGFQQLLGQNKKTIPIQEWLNPDFVRQQQLQDRYTEIVNRQPVKARMGMTSEPLWSNIFAWSSPGFHGMPVKIRFPFFDVRLISYLQTVPPVPWFIDKRMLRQSMVRRLPATVINRPKSPLPGSAHFNLMQQHGLQDWMKVLASHEALQNYVRGGVLLRSLDDPDRMSASSFNSIMPPLILSHWMSSFSASVNNTQS